MSECGFRSEVIIMEMSGNRELKVNFHTNKKMKGSYPLEDNFR